MFFSMPVDLHSLTWRHLNASSVIYLANTDPLYFDEGLFEKSWKYLFFWVYTSKTKRKIYIYNFWGRSINLHTIYLSVCQCSWLFVSVPMQIPESWLYICYGVTQSQSFSCLPLSQIHTWKTQNSPKTPPAANNRVYVAVRFSKQIPPAC